MKSMSTAGDSTEQPPDVKFGFTHAALAGHQHLALADHFEEVAGHNAAYEGQGLVEKILSFIVVQETNSQRQRAQW